jgi:hypothetical protein
VSIARLKTILRISIVVEFLLALVYLAIAPPSPVASAPHWQIFVVAFISLFGLLARIGLFFFWRWARILYVLCMAVDLVTMPFEPVTPHTPLTSAISQFTIYLAGFVVALIYFSPIRELYARSTKTV